MIPCSIDTFWYEHFAKYTAHDILCKRATSLKNETRTQRHFFTKVHISYNNVSIRCEAYNIIYVYIYIYVTSNVIYLMYKMQSYNKHVLDLVFYSNYIALAIVRFGAE